MSISFPSLFPFPFQFLFNHLELNAHSCQITHGVFILLQRNPCLQPKDFGGLNSHSLCRGDRIVLNIAQKKIMTKNNAFCWASRTKNLLQRASGCCWIFRISVEFRVAILIAKDVSSCSTVNFCSYNMV